MSNDRFSNGIKENMEVLGFNYRHTTAVLSWKCTPQIVAMFVSLKWGVKILTSEGTRPF
jgi:hypothetical protein